MDGHYPDSPSRKGLLPSCGDWGQCQLPAVTSFTVSVSVGEPWPHPRSPPWNSPHPGTEPGLAKLEQCRLSDRHSSLHSSLVGQGFLGPASQFNFCLGPILPPPASFLSCWPLMNVSTTNSICFQRSHLWLLSFFSLQHVFLLRLLGTKRFWESSSSSGGLSHQSVISAVDLTLPCLLGKFHGTFFGVPGCEGYIYTCHRALIPSWYWYDFHFRERRITWRCFKNTKLSF